jgi:hypothetical protein
MDVIVLQPSKTQHVKLANNTKCIGWATMMPKYINNFHFKYSKEYKKACCWEENGTQPKMGKVSNPMVVHVYVGITKPGNANVHYMVGTSRLQSQQSNLKGQPGRNITSSEYKKVLDMTLLQEGDKKLMAKGCTKCIFQHDNNHIHKIVMATMQAWHKV